MSPSESDVSQRSDVLVVTEAARNTMSPEQYQAMVQLLREVGRSFYIDLLAGADPSLAQKSKPVVEEHAPIDLGVGVNEANLAFAGGMGGTSWD